MILNEDFFDDIEIKDDDLKSDETGLYTDDIKDTNTLITNMFSSYKQCLCFEFSTPFDENRYRYFWNLFDKTNKWNLFRNNIRRVCNVFNAYDIKYSEPLFCTMYDWKDIIHKKSDINLDIIDIENNKVLVKSVYNTKPYKRLPRENWLFIIMFIDLPVFNSAKRAYKFLYRMTNNLCICDDDAVDVYHLNKDNQEQDYVNDGNLKMYFNNVRINFIIKSTMLQLIKDEIFYLLSPQYKYRQEFEKADTDRELQDLIKNH